MHSLLTEKSVTNANLNQKIKLSPDLFLNNPCQPLCACYHKSINLLLSLFFLMTINPTIEIRDLRQQDWIWTSKLLLFHEKIDGNNFKVYCGLAAYANNSTQEAFPSVITLSKRLHMARNTVLKGLSALVDNGFISIEKSTGEHNVYSLLHIAGDKPTYRKATEKLPKTETKESGENWVKEILQWAEARRGTKYVNYGRSIGALGAMKKSGYMPEEIKACYLILEASDFWRERGFDFKNVGDELPKKINTIRKQLHGTSLFDHVVQR